MLPRAASLIACWQLLLLASTEASAAAPDARQNVLVILLDNVGQEWFGCYGSEEKCTPNIDRLAATGVRAVHCYTPPVCGPSRTTLLTGRYLHHTGFRLHHDAALYSGGGLDPQREVLFPRLFRRAGYVTGMAGKWQVNNLYDEPDIISRHGFTESLVWPGSIDREKTPPAVMQEFWQAVERQDADRLTQLNKNIESRYWDPVFIEAGQRSERRGKFGPDECQQWAIDFLRRHREQPFLLYLPMMLTHGQSFSQHVVPTPLNKATDRPEQEMFADMLRYADKLVGELIAELARLGLRENTLVIVASDNGTEKSFKARANGRLVQGDLYQLTEAGGDVVLLANQPKRIPGGRTIQLADFTDIYPTVCEWAGVPLSPQHQPDGKSLAAFLSGKADKPPRNWILNEYHETRVVRDEHFKLYSDGRMYDAEGDRTEQQDLANNLSDPVVTARQKLKAVLASLPADTPPPFVLRSLSGFKIRSQAKANQQKSSQTAPGRLKVIATLTHAEALAGAHDIEVVQSRAYIAGKGGSLAVVNVGNPREPKLEWFQHDPQGLADAETVLPWGQRLLVGTRNLEVFDLQQGPQLRHLQTLADRPRIDYINGMARREHLVVAANKKGWIDAFDVSDSSTVKFLGAVPVKERDGITSPHDIDVFGDHLIVVDGNGFGRDGRPGKVAVYQIADLSTHKLLPIDQWRLASKLERQDLAGANRVRTSGPHALVGCSVGSRTTKDDRRGTGVIIDLSNPNEVCHLATHGFSDAAGPNGSEMNGQLGFLAGGQTIEVLDLRDPAAPKLIAKLHSPEAFPTANDNAHDLDYVNGGYLYVTNQSDHRLVIVYLDDPDLRTLADTPTLRN